MDDVKHHISFLFMMKITPQRAIATMEIHLPAGPVMVFTTFSKGLENSVMPPEARANSGKSRRHKAERLRRTLKDVRADLCRENACTRMTFSAEAVMRRLAGARGPQV